MKVLIGAAVAALALNAVLIGMLVHQYNETAPIVDDAKVVFSAARDLMDYPNRVLHGSVVRTLTNFIQMDYAQLSKNVTKLSTSVQDIFDTASDEGQLQVARYSALVTSVAKKVGTVQPSFPVIPKPSDDQGLVNVLSYLTEWTSQQLDRSELRSLASSCVTLLDSALNLDWSGRYTWGQWGSASYNANPYKQNVAQVYQYCYQISRLQPSAEIGVEAVEDNVKLGMIGGDAAALNAVKARLHKMLSAAQPSSSA